jgi:hypothetical protein
MKWAIGDWREKVGCRPAFGDQPSRPCSMQGRGKASLLQAGKCNSGFCIIKVYFEAGYDDENQRNIIKRLTDLSDYQLFFPERSDGLESVSMQELSFY